MKVLLLQLSDLHIGSSEISHSIDVAKMERALNVLEKTEECIVVISGDLAAKGIKQDYIFVRGFLFAVFKKLVCKKYKGKHIECICVPGNHDIDFENLNINLVDLETDDIGLINQNIDKYLNAMKNYFFFSKKYNCFVDNELVSKRILDFGGCKLGFVMVNSAPMSLLGGKAEDMGMHFLPSECIEEISKTTDADINILVMHHSLEWFNDSCKEKLRAIISNKYALVISGHEHSSVGESKVTNNSGTYHWIQGNALTGFSNDANGFCAMVLDFDRNQIKGYSFKDKDDMYIHTEIFNGELKHTLHNRIELLTEFKNELAVDDNQNIIKDYYVFQGMVYNIIKDDGAVDRFNIENETEFISLIEKNGKVLITGDHKSGKTVLSHILYEKLYESGKTPLLIKASEINKKKIIKVIEHAFCEQYKSDNNAFEYFNQLPYEDKFIIIDEGNLIEHNKFEVLIQYFEKNFKHIVVFSEETINLNIKKQVMEVMSEGKDLHIEIKPFLYSKRKELIEKVLRECDCSENDIEKETKKINELINVQLKYFNLTPEFIINFVNQYEKEYRFHFTSGMNVFNVVYETSIRNKVIDNSINIDPTHVLNILRELAYYMHFNKKQYAKIDEIIDICEEYSNTYRQKVNSRLFLEAAIKSRILSEKIDQYRFKDHTITAYFVAQAINQKYNQGENIDENIEYLLRNLCFNINSDIVLFLALITSNTKFINYIFNGARKHFENKEELSFDRENIKYIINASIPVKNTLPTLEEKNKREQEVSNQEEDAKLNELIEVVDEYDYTEEDLNKIENQVIISFKYLEILCKSLPAFCQNMKAEQQDELVELIYKCPNQFLCDILKEINDNFNDFVEGLYAEISELRHEKNKVDVNIESIKRMIEVVSSSLVISLYQLVSVTCTSDQSIQALNAFDLNDNSNYQLMNLMMNSLIDNVDVFSKKAKSIYNSKNKKIEKTMVKYIVRNYFLNNSIPLYGEGQSLADTFFPGESNTTIKMERAQKRILHDK